MARFLRSFAAGFAAALLLSVVFLGGYLAGSRQPAGSAAALPEKDILFEVYDLLEANFLGEIPDARQQVYAAIHGLTSSYKDPYTVFVEPAAREVERDDLRGHYGGIGAQLGRNDGGEMVLTVMRDRPASRAGVLDGDILLAVDQSTITAEMSVQDVIALIRGDIGSVVRLTLRREETGPFDVDIVRERIETPSVEWRMLDQEQHIGYAKISIFAENTSKDLLKGLEEMQSQGVNRLVLDLRGNGGGLLESAVQTASLFFSHGDVLREVKRGGQERYYPAKSGSSPAQTWEIALLVDGGTASASEIVAGALRDNERGVLIGEKTFGKGSVQEVHQLRDGSSLHVTVARWLTPSRHQIDKAGLEPDITVTISPDDRVDGRDPQLARAQAWLAGMR